MGGPYYPRDCQWADCDADAEHGFLFCKKHESLTRSDLEVASRYRDAIDCLKVEVGDAHMRYTRLVTAMETLKLAHSDFVKQCEEKCRESV